MEGRGLGGAGCGRERVRGTFDLLGSIQRDRDNASRLVSIVIGDTGGGTRREEEES